MVTGLCVAILAIDISDSRDFVNHSYDYRPDWTTLGPITFINIRVGYILGTVYMDMGDPR